MQTSVLSPLESMAPSILTGVYELFGKCFVKVKCMNQVHDLKQRIDVIRLIIKCSHYCKYYSNHNNRVLVHAREAL